MPEPKPSLPGKPPVAPAKPSQPPTPPPGGQNKKNPLPKQKTPAQEKDDAFKYEMQYANGGFNNGVEIKPDRDGKAQLKISIYGGGEQKVLKVSPLPPEITKLISAYEIGANANDTSTPEITGELQKYFDQIRNVLSGKIIAIMTEADEKIKTAIGETFKSTNGK